MDKRALALRCCALGLLSLLVASKSLPAQGVRVIAARTWPLDSIVSRFEAGVRANAANNLGSEIMFEIARLSASHTARKDSLLDRLEHLVVSNPDKRVRVYAAYEIAFAGERGGNRMPIPGVVHRLARIYHSTAHADVRSPILDQLPLQAERAAAIALLRSVASEPDPGNDGRGPHGYFSLGDPRTEALARLTEMVRVEGHPSPP
ncbi:MAG TPA: hypothetical protein VF092_05110 [Longimicrobium sp.]